MAYVKLNLTNGTVLTAEHVAHIEAGIEDAGNTDGLTTAEKTLILSLFEKAAYTEDMSATYNQLATLWDAETESGGDDTHTHSYTSSVTTAATCTTAGVRTYTCSCGESYTEEIPATGHIYAGGVCTICGAVDPNYTGETDDYEVHNFSEYSWTNGGILSNNTLKEYANYSYSEYIPCEAGVCYETNAVFDQPIAGMYDENDNYLSDISSTGIMFINNNNAKQMRLNALTSDILSAYFKRYVHDSSSPNHVFPEYKWTLGSYVNASGEIADMGSYAYSEYIPVESGEEILLCTNAPNFSIAFYDANKEFTRTVDAGSTSTEVSINVASDEQYFVLNASAIGCGSKGLYWKYAE